MPGLMRLDKAAASASKRRQFHVLLTVTAPHERIIFTVAVLLILALLTWVLFGRIEHGITVDGVLIKPGDRYEVVSVEPGHLIEFLVRPGDRVKDGDEIARQSVPELNREIAALRRSVDLLERENPRSGENSASILPRLAAARAALLEMEARRTAREMIIAHIGGEVMAFLSEPGSFVSAGTSVARIRNSFNVEPGSIQAVLRVEPSIAQRIRTGLTATVEVTVPGSDPQRLTGEVGSVTAGPLPKWLASLQPATEDSLHRIDIMLRQVPESPLPGGSSCRVRIVLGKAPPIALLSPGLL